MSQTALAPIVFDRTGLTNEELISLYRRVILPRLIEEKMLILLRQGKISKWFSSFGQEGISVGCAMALQPDEWILPMHRNLGVFTSRDMPLNRLFSQFQGKMNGFTKGRDRSFHFGSKEHKVWGMISHLGPQLGIADGLALASKLGKEGQAVLVFSGDGGASEGDFHEALNVAAVWELPVIFVIENNGWGLSTPSNEQFRCASFVDKGPGYGIEATSIDGNNLLEVYSTVKSIAASLRENPRPFLLECRTFRIRGHEEASGTKYYPEGVIDTWSKKDPVENYERYLVETGMLTEGDVVAIREEYKALIASELEVAFAEPNVTPDTAFEKTDLFKEWQQEIIEPISDARTDKRFIDAVQDGMRLSMRRHPNLVLMGQDIAEYGGVFKVTEGFVQEFGKDRVRNTPLCESAIIGAALGLSMKGYKAMVEMQFADFVTCGFNQIVNNLAKLHYRWNENADVVIRMPTGAGVGAGPFHSQSNEAWFFHTPGLKILYPSNPYDAKGMLCAAFNDPNPVIFFEHKALYRSLTESIPDDYYTVEIGKAGIVRSGEQMSIITYGMGVHWALQAVNQSPDIDAEIIDLRTLMPLDTEAIYFSVNKTGKCLVLHEDCLTGGIGGEIAALVSEHCFESLDAPVVRVASLDTPVPFAIPLENNFLPVERLKEAIKKLAAY